MQQNGKSPNLVFWLIALACLPLFGSRVARAGETLDTNVVEAALFKNGLGFLVREADLPGSGEYVVKHLPVPVHGSVWILPLGAATKVESAVAFSQPREERKLATTLADLVKANVGKAVWLNVEPEGKMEGRIISVLEPEPILPVSLAELGNVPNPHYDYNLPRVYRPRSVYAVQPPHPGGVVLIDRAEGSFAFPLSAIKSIAAPEGRLNREVVQRQPGAALRLKVAGEGGRLRIASLCWGLTWAPSYLIDLSDSKTATLNCKAEIVNDIEDLNNVTVQFVTGYPNLAFAEVVSPLALLGDVPDFLESLMRAAEPRRRGREAGVLAQSAMSNVALDFRSLGIPSLTPAQGEVREDLFLYPLPGVTLPRNQRGYYPLFTLQVPYDNLYLWEIEDALDEYEYWRYRGQPREPAEPQQEVWHVVELTNDGELPWTTAPAMLMQASRVLGQDVLPYAAAGGKTRVKVTRAIDVVAEENEREIKRQRNALQIYGMHYDLVTVEGRLRVVNHKNKQISLRIKKKLSGEVLESTPQASIETTARGLRRANQRQILTWELPIEPGVELDVTYKYEVHVAH